MDKDGKVIPFPVRRPPEIIGETKLSGADMANDYHEALQNAYRRDRVSKLIAKASGLGGFAADWDAISIGTMQKPMAGGTVHVVSNQEDNLLVATSEGFPVLLNLELGFSKDQAIEVASEFTLAFGAIQQRIFTKTKSVSHTSNLRNQIPKFAGTMKEELWMSNYRGTERAGLAVPYRAAGLVVRTSTLAGSSVTGRLSSGRSMPPHFAGIANPLDALEFKNLLI